MVIPIDRTSDSRKLVSRFPNGASTRVTMPYAPPSLNVVATDIEGGITGVGWLAGGMRPFMRR
jgi:hypothetical protein